MRSLLSILLLVPSLLWAAPQDYGVNYDIVYVRYAATNPDPTTDFVVLPQGEDVYSIQYGADLMLLKPDGTQTVLVDCDTDCSVMDPFVSYDGQWVYYVKIVGIGGKTPYGKQSAYTAGYLFKMNLANGAPYSEIQLTYPQQSDSVKYAGSASADYAAHMPIRDTSPVPLADGRILFTSNRAGHHQFNQDTNYKLASVQQLYVMDDHDGSLNTPALANMKHIDESNMMAAQHPIQLMDGRILTSTWQNFGVKFRYAMTTLFTMHPDGSNLQQFTEPHDHHKNLEHYITQLSDESIVVGWYYPSYDYGFGRLMKFELDPAGVNFYRDPTGSNSFREFERKGRVDMTPHSEHKDVPVIDASGKYAMPSAAPNNGMLVAYSTGYVNHFGAVCNPDRCENLKSGIYLIPNATSTIVTDPTDTSLLQPMVDDPLYNEIWPRAVATFQATHGIEKPAIIPDAKDEPPLALTHGEATAIIGTSSMLNRESDHGGVFGGSGNRELTAGDWTIQGTDVGVFTDDDIWGVRILSIPELVFSSPLASISSLEPYASDFRIDQIVKKFASVNNESWEILGEFPLTHKATTDAQGNPDTSWMAKIPAEIPTTIQAIDVNGMTLVSETVWRSLAPGEVRVDCGGCHAHSIDPLDWDTTQAGNASPITGVVGVLDTDERIQGGMWDLSGDSVPLVGENGEIYWESGGSYDVEFNRDIVPILTANCVSCHTSGQSNGGLILDGTGGASDPWLVINKSTGYRSPQTSKYIRTPQARESMFVWVAWGERLDGRTNSTRSDDIDYPTNHPAVNLSFADKQKIARWVDLGSPTNLPADTGGFGYTDDNQLPTVTIVAPATGTFPKNRGVRVGFNDAQSGIDWATLSLTVAPVSNLQNTSALTNVKRDERGIVTASFPTLTVGQEYLFTAVISDNTGNTETKSVRFTAGGNVTLPAAVNVGVSQ